MTALTTVTRSKDAVVTSAIRQLSHGRQLSTAAEQRIGNFRIFLLTGAAEDLAAIAENRSQFHRQAAELGTLFTDPVKLGLLNEVADAETTYTAALDRTIELRKAITNLEQVAQLNAEQVSPARRGLQQAIGNLINRVQADLSTAREASSRTATEAIAVICALGTAAVICAVVIARRLNRGLRRKVGAAVGQIQSSSQELETTAERQASGSRDQAGAMNEITTTITELLITSRQIADNAHRVSKIAEDTAQAAQNGGATIDQTRASIAAIRTQMDQIVQHMLVLGEKSQQIGGVVDLVSELAEQTNILAINAAIEASGAGEHGRRFAVVAEEIRKLADRTTESAKQIRTLIDDVRGAVNTTVTATEIGTGAVDTGVRQFGDATTAFRRITHLVSTANDASREIELSTKQQSSAVEQVNTAAADTARVTRETQTTAVQTKHTATHLSSLSNDLQKLVGTGYR
ncbi:hypothetical protein Ari01nite_23610 [Paractinoplanes rishiriensis]|uniref:Methyl-accepting transducer domain-containing protein n=1 Tax=Paractinoplanes rishiriensis TaxID=1050105 RepID=A0A919MPB1_9ACTN|nr:hypothetical protein Ari01nite_23610 [Actinoplanes rishiriensis]